jgi:hypothetical protein
MAAGFIDPVAQTFFVEPSLYSKGIFVHSVDLIFKKKDVVTYQPFVVQLRPTVNGYPHSTIIHSSSALGQVSLYPENINTVDINTDVPSFTNAAHYTRFTFPAPVYLTPGEHAMVLFSNSDDYEVFVAEVGGVRIGDTTGRRIDKQVYVGSFFKSQNGLTYTAYQDLDLMFRVNFCRFTDNTTYYLYANNSLPTTNTEYDLIKLSSQDLTFKDTSINYFYKSKSNSTLTLDSDFSNVIINENEFLEERKIVTTTGQSIVLRADLRTTDNTVSPVIDTSRLNATSIKYIINDCGLTDSNFAITNSGTGYTANAVVTITSNQGTGADAVAVANVTTGKIDSIKVTTNGSGYVGDITVSIAAPAVPAGNTTAACIVAQETASKGGPALARYITRNVTLADGFDANMIRVYLTAYQPPQSTIELYYSVLAEEDPTNFIDRPYVRMKNVQPGNEGLTNDSKSQVETDFLEYLFIPFTDDTSYIGTTNNVNYNSFKTFAIKIVMRTSNPSYTPVIRDLRVLALAP